MPLSFGLFGKAFGAHAGECVSLSLCLCLCLSLYLSVFLSLKRCEAEMVPLVSLSSLCCCCLCSAVLSFSLPLPPPLSTSAPPSAPSKRGFYWLVLPYLSPSSHHECRSRKWVCGLLTRKMTFTMKTEVLHCHERSKIEFDLEHFMPRVEVTDDQKRKLLVTAGRFGICVPN